MVSEKDYWPGSKLFESRQSHRSVIGSDGLGFVKANFILVPRKRGILLFCHLPTVGSYWATLPFFVEKIIQWYFAIIRKQFTQNDVYCLLAFVRKLRQKNDKDIKVINSTLNHEELLLLQIQCIVNDEFNI